MAGQSTLLEARFGAALEAAPDAIVLVDSDGQIVLVNTAVEQLFGWGRAELVGRSVDVLVPDTLRPGHASHRSVFFGTRVAGRWASARSCEAVAKMGLSFRLKSV